MHHPERTVLPGVRWRHIGALLIGHRTFVGDDPNRGTDQEGAYSGTWDGPSSW